MKAMDSRLSNIASAIESIGRNCEWGAIQREKFGTDPISLLRWSGSKDKALLAEAFRSRFSGLGDKMSGQGVPGHLPENKRFYWLTDETYNIIFHTSERPTEKTVEEARIKTAPRLRRQAEILFERMSDPATTFLYSDADLSNFEDASDLINAFMSAGRARLIVVIQNSHFAGTAQSVDRRLAVGRVRKLTPPGQANTYDFETWSEMLYAVDDLFHIAKSPFIPAA